MLISICARKGVLKMLMSFVQYLRDIKAELKHVNWPSKKQATIYTILVILISLFVSVYLGVFDYIFANLLSKIIG